MSERNEMGCDALAEVAPELALGVLTGRERAQALAHLETCESCRENVRQLTVTGEELLGLLPVTEPPPGFETRVMERLGLAAAPSPDPAIGRTGRLHHELSTRSDARRRGRAGRGRRLLAAAAVLAALAASGLGGWYLRAASTPPARSSLSSTALVSASHHVVGRLYVNPSPRWVFMSVDMNTRSTTVNCQLLGPDGQVASLGQVWLVNGRGYWGSPEPSDWRSITGARLTSADGAVLATATFASAVGSS